MASKKSFVHPRRRLKIFVAVKTLNKKRDWKMYTGKAPHRTNNEAHYKGGTLQRRHYISTLRSSLLEILASIS